VADFAAACGALPADIDTIKLAVSEAFTNAVIHAYRSGPGDVQVTAALAGGELWVLVSDEGCGHQTPPVSPGMGLGLALIAQASEDFVITERSTGGTEVRMRFPLPSTGTADASERPGA
jgi:anti-sigma regulatory factor (Ser/Thr protein kinase)